MFCWKCGEVIEDGEELCQECRKENSKMNKIMGGILSEGGKIGEDILKSSNKEFQKAVEKKAKQMTNKAMKAVGLKKKTPLDKAKDMWKEIKK